MKSAVETLDPTRVKLVVEVPFDELKPNLDRAYKQIAEQVTVPGFRKGKIPPRIIDQRFGRGAVLEQAINEAMPGFYDSAVREATIRPLGQPQIEVTQVPGGVDTDENADLVFTAEVDVRPEITIPDLDGYAVSVDSVDVSDADIDERLDALRERFGTLVGVDRPAADGDFVSIDISAKVDGEEVDSVSGISYQVGAGNMLEGLDEALVGLSADESTTFEAPLAGGDKAGTLAVITVTAQSVKQRDLPEADDDFAQLASEFDTLEELRADLSQQVAKAKANNQAVQARNALLEQLVEAVEIPLPTRVVDAEVAHHLESEGKEADDPHGEEVRGDTERALRHQLLLDELVDHLNVSVNQNELIEYLVQASSQYGMDPSTFISAVDQQGQIPAMAGEVARSKALAVALRQVEVKDADGADVDLSEFIGSDEADAAAAAAAEAAAKGGDDAEPTGADDPASIRV